MKMNRLIILLVCILSITVASCGKISKNISFNESTTSTTNQLPQKPPTLNSEKILSQITQVNSNNSQLDSFLELPNNITTIHNGYIKIKYPIINNHLPKSGIKAYYIYLWELPRRQLIATASYLNQQTDENLTNSQITKNTYLHGIDTIYSPSISKTTNKEYLIGIYFWDWNNNTWKFGKLHLNNKSAMPTQKTELQNLMLNQTNSNNNIISFKDPILKKIISNKLSNKPLTQKNIQQILNLKANYQKIKYLDGIEMLTNLESLELYSNNIESISALKNLKNLKKIDLGKNKISNLDPLKELTSLETLFIDNNLISDFTPINNLKKLTSLYINNNTSQQFDSLTITSELKNKDFIISSKAPVSNQPYSTNNNIQFFSQTSINYFSEISLGAEYGGSKKITKWTKHPIVKVNGNYTSQDIQELQKIIQEINSISSTIKLNLILDNSKKGDINIFFCPRKEFYKFINSPHVHSAEAFVRVFINSNNEITSSKIVINSNQSNKTIKNSTIREELTQSLGLLNDSWLYSNSIFYQGSSNTTSYSKIDKDVIALLYSKDIKPGYTKNDIMSIYSAKSLSINSN
ncbi:hypothetical protein DID75_02810 [Candidatus Marinamargulisbacteria bacterium SCGC AG-410-N11]|nr:hypothetical protein DID75_02810 [Candidatus Marinamargulisbacteria bacterium SCGC AG-410-N11]